MFCRLCGYEQPESNRFCEECGAAVHVAGPAAPHPGACPECGAGPEAADGEGFCGRCGHQRPTRRDRLEITVAAHLAGVSDRGKVHHRNEDFLALGALDGGEVLVVCDGVSSSQNAGLAAQVAAQAACASLLQALGAGTTVGPTTLGAALVAAQEAVADLSYVPRDGEDPPQTTIVAAAIQRRRVTLGWLGDSRAYYLTPDGGRQLTEDHSWVNEVVAAGRMSLSEARRAPLARAVTRSLGGRGPADEPSLTTFDVPPGPGFLLLCTDGLWTCVPEPAHLAALLHSPARGPDAMAAARLLVGHARDRCGHDNITAVLHAFPSPTIVGGPL